MKISKSTINVILYCIIFVLVAALICSAVVIKQKDDKLKKFTAEITANEELLETVEAKIKSYEAEIAEKNKANSDMTAQLEAAKNEKKRLEQENSALKKQIETLSAEKAPFVSPQNPVPPGSKICYLTFDDGPSDNTLKILDTLKKYNAKATFFVVGTSSKLNYVKRIHAEGHTVGLHTDTHKIYKNNGSENIYLSTDAYFRDLNNISNKVKNLIGIESKVIRFPGGSSNQVSAQVSKGIMTKLSRMVGERGYSYFDWNVSSGDAGGKLLSSSAIVNNVLSQSKNKNSVCVLMHDTSAKPTTAAAVEGIITGLTQMGFRFEGLKPGDHGYHHPIAN